MSHGLRPNLSNLGHLRRVFESLMAFYPGMQVLMGETVPAARSLNSFFLVREFLGFLPERFNFAHWQNDGGIRGAGRHPLRPELLESSYFLHRATATSRSFHSGQVDSSFSGWQWASDFALQKLNEMTKTTFNQILPCLEGFLVCCFAKQGG